MQEETHSPFYINLTIKSEGNQWISLTGYSIPLKVVSQKPPATVSEVEELMGKHTPRPPSISKLMSTINT